MSKLRCLSARRDPEINIELELSDILDEPPLWRYAIGIKQETRGYRQPYVSFERVWYRGKKILNRPDPEDKKDPERLKQTFLEQVNTNTDFREIVRYFESISYIHLVPQLQQLRFERDGDTGQPHLAALYSHWRPKAGWQSEDQFSDGTLRLIGLLWALLDSDSLLLLEEPELSLNSGIVSYLAPLIYRLQKQRKRQVFISTHSEALLSDQGIDGREVLLISPSPEGSTAKIASAIEDVKPLLEAGLSVGEAVLPRNRPKDIIQLGLFE